MKIPWALDEDLRQVQEALGDLVCWTSFPRARIIQAAWPAAIATIPVNALRDKFVVCQADNPPAFYLGTREFVHAGAVVNLWIARSREALRQFELLGLPAVLAPYTIDSSIFRQTPDREEIRREVGVYDRDFLIGNFHRDSEGADLKQPKMQKGPDILFEIARRANSLIPNLVVLLAGPRRHWLASALRAEGIRTVFGGPEPGEDDDYGRANLSRERLNQLYQAMDCCVVRSRWEGGPYGVLEALAAGCPVIVKAHSAHPGTAELVGRTVQLAVKQCGMHEGTFSLFTKQLGRKSEKLDITMEALQQGYRQRHYSTDLAPLKLIRWP
jgi:glycosyltransferase involved in cell wall biosynthesis